MAEQEKSSQIDRRSEKRIRSQVSIKYRMRGDTKSEAKVSTTTDISAGGINFESAELIAMGSQLDIELVIPLIEKPLATTGRVVRIEEITKGNYLIGVGLEWSKDDDYHTLAKYAQHINLDELLAMAVKRKASDVHLVANQPPIFRIDGVLTPLDIPPLSGKDTSQMIYSIMNDVQRKIFDDTMELDSSYAIPGGTRFRVNVHIDKGNIEAALRLIPYFVKGAVELGLPKVVIDLAMKPKGLIILTGPAGTGKSTTLAAIVDIINKERKSVVISIEDPIEYVHQSQKSIIKQREVGADTLSFASALKHILRQDPNVILVGEVRDLESISMAITAAETGHLVLTTLHTPDASGAVSRIVDVYPPMQQNQARAQIAECLEAVIAQILLPRKDGQGRIVATEVLIATQAARHIIRQGATEQLYSLIQTGSKYGMRTMDDSLLDLLKKGLITKDVALVHAKDKMRINEFVQMSTTEGGAIDGKDVLR